MKITEEKHNHKLTNLLKVFIFSVLMLLPFLNVAVRCGYVMLNKNAYQSYYGQTINEEIINNTTYNELELNTRYTYTSPASSITITQNVLKDIYVNNFNYQGDISTNTGANWDIKTTNRITISTNTANTYILFYFYNSNENSYYYRSTVYQFNYSFYLSNNIETDDSLNSLINFSYITYNDYSFMDNVFEYSLNKLEEEQYLTWTQNTAVYQGVESMTTGLGITQTVIPMLIVYWFILTIIYVIIDIVLALFTKLTHMIGNKTT